MIFCYIFLFQNLSKLFFRPQNLHQRCLQYLNDWKKVFSSNDVSLNFLQSIIYSSGDIPFRNNRINLLILWLKYLHVFKNRSSNISSNFYWWFLLQHKHFYSIKPFLFYQIFILHFFYKCFRFFAFSYDSCARLLIVSHFSLRSLLKINSFFIQSLPLYTSCLFSILLIEDIVDIEKPDGKCSLTLVVDEFSGSFSHPSIFSIKHSRSV